MCRVTYCCCRSFSLEKGCKILAIIGLIGGGIGLAQGIIGLVVSASGIIRILSSITYVVASALLLWGTLKRKTTPVLAYLIFQAISVVLMAIFIVIILVSSLVAGSVAADDLAQGKYELDGSDGNYSNEDAANTARTATITAVIISANIYGGAIALSIYFWIVVYSFFRELKEGGAGGGGGQVMGMSAKA